MNHDELVKVISERAEYWRDLYNKCPMNDRDESVEDFAKGSFMALYDLLKYITHEQYQ